MKPRCRRSTVDRLPTISEMQESDIEDGDLDFSSHTMEEYVDSIKELSQPACYPLHGPLRGHRRWRVSTSPAVSAGAPSFFLSSSRSHSSWLPIDPSDVTLILTEHSDYDLPLRVKQSLMDMLVSRSLFAGLV
ncbi:uncharacterized protein si:ch73-6k14.2 [Melanotaenia boesemani]|uniref:uncharacterized protein si:ch73-6k14.2 n=1 Tax=Melanotaenia boesemani TaxID=1250792 RepID=UPI001C050878|nr:uncharacterized protein si:ch73-6k14.2 [Melanotaenia boesemani]